MPASVCDQGVSSSPWHQRVQSMRHERGTLGIFLAEMEGEGGAGLDKPLYRLNKKIQESSDPSDMLFRMNQSAFNVNGNSPNEELSLEMKNYPSNVPDLQESIRNSILATAVSKAMALCFAPTEKQGAEEQGADVLRGVGKALMRDWQGRGLEPWLWYACLQPMKLPGYHRLDLLQLGMGIFEDELPSAFLEMSLDCLPCTPVFLQPSLHVLKSS